MSGEFNFFLIHFTFAFVGILEFVNWKFANVLLSATFCLVLWIKLNMYANTHGIDGSGMLEMARINVGTNQKLAIFCKYQS